MSLRIKRIDKANMQAAAYLAQQHSTCEGCAFLQRHPRPQCKGEGSAHFRMVRDTYHARCETFTPRGKTGLHSVKP
jgi:hypothetical protein